MCSENSGLCQAISELVQRSGKALRHGLEPRLESLALRLGRIDWKPARCELRAALVLGESADTGRVSATLPQSDKGRVARHPPTISNRLRTGISICYARAFGELAGRAGYAVTGSWFI
jgi:hypothetical protein